MSVPLPLAPTEGGTQSCPLLSAALYTIGLQWLWMGTNKMVNLHEFCFVFVWFLSVAFVNDNVISNAKGEDACRVSLLAHLHLLSTINSVFEFYTRQHAY